ncbi:MAG: right-handed parallel beta-helix repeat-containing protein, partial [Promethearchaeota archaeon]
GAGIALTKIDVFDKVTPCGDKETGQATFLFTFDGGDICISDLSFDITKEKPAEPWFWHGIYNEDLTSPLCIKGEINSQIDHIKCTGREGTLVMPSVGSWNVRVGIAFWATPHSEWFDGVEYVYGEPGFTGRHVITNCDFDSVGIGISVSGLMDGEMKIESNTFKGGYIGILNWDTVNSKIEISNNYIETRGWGGIYIGQFSNPRYTARPVIPIESSSQWLIAHNSLKVSYSADGIILGDISFRSSGIKSIETVISHNKIILDDTYYGGIYTLGLKDAFISNNEIHGTGFYGIECDFAYNNLILGNNIQNVDAFWAPIILYYAIYCVVVGGSTKTNVWDMWGINNILVGVNNMQGNPPGPEIQEAMEQKMKIIQSI